MALTVALQMDPMEGINIDADSSFALAEEAQRRGHSLFHYLPRTLRLEDGRVSAVGHAMNVQRVRGDHVCFGAREPIDLAQMDVVLLRQDPPFDLTYITTTHILDHIHPKTLVVNDPAGVRNAPEKILVTDFPDLMPPTLISADPEAIRDFRARHRDIILKPLFGNGGAGVFHLRPDDENLGALLDMFFVNTLEPLMIQTYLPAVREGDKRIILIDGEAAGALNRVPKDGDARSNMHVGGRAEPAVLTKRDHDICRRIGPVLKARGLLFVGLDVIGNYVTEINVTSPTGIQEIGRFDKTNLAARIWDAIEAKYTATRT
ncbi:MAG: glutathione synthase [Rhodospirillaceae bacterium]|nr:glutathione synthase [Rhodospirillaceae bacterium]